MEGEAIMIYLNNGATSWPKPQCVSNVIKKALDELPCSAHRSSFDEEENRTISKFTSSGQP